MSADRFRLRWLLVTSIGFWTACGGYDSSPSAASRAALTTVGEADGGAADDAGAPDPQQCGPYVCAEGWTCVVRLGGYPDMQEPQYDCLTECWVTDGGSGCDTVFLPPPENDPIIPPRI